MQLLHGYDEVNFPFVIASDGDDLQEFFAKFNYQVFLVNVNTQKRVPLLNLKEFGSSKIKDIKQTSKFAAT